ncbi:hypothetical protein ACHWQZ_G009897 [Mnemiopsis leidyi]
MSKIESYASPEVRDTRTSYIQERGLVPDYGDYSAWQRTPGMKSSDSTITTMSERPTSPETEIVRLQIKARRKTLQQYQKMQTKLVTCNLELMGGIQENENDVHDKVTALLEQYEKFRGAIGNIRNESEESVRCARVLLEETKEKTSADLESLEKEYEDLERKVLERTNECEVLVKFKGTDKEYHLRVARVNELRLELENLTTEQKTERTELSELVERHHTNLNLGTDKRCREIQANLTATAVKNIPDSLRELAQQNRVMKRELLLHQESVYETEQEIEQLKEDIRQLQKQFKKKSRFVTAASTDICTPDTELSLDIPTYKLLPV